MVTLFIFTQHAGLPLQQRKDVLVEEQRAEAEEVPQAQVGHGAPVPHARLGLDHRRLRHRDLQHLLARQAVAAGHDHPLLAGAARRQEAPQWVDDVVPDAWHCTCASPPPSKGAPTGEQYEGSEGSSNGEAGMSLHPLIGPTS